MRNVTIIHYDYALFWNGNNGLQCEYFVNNGLHYTVLLWTDIFWISYIKWYKFYNSNLSVVLGSKPGGAETCEPQTWELSINSIVDSLSLKFLVYFAKMSSYFSQNSLKIPAKTNAYINIQ